MPRRWHCTIKRIVACDYMLAAGCFLLYRFEPAVFYVDKMLRAYELGCIIARLVFCWRLSWVLFVRVSNAATLVCFVVTLAFYFAGRLVGPPIPH